MIDTIRNGICYRSTDSLLLITQFQLIWKWDLKIVLSKTFMINGQSKGTEWTSWTRKGWELLDKINKKCNNYLFLT